LSRIIPHPINSVLESLLKYLYHTEKFLSLMASISTTTSGHPNILLLEWSKIQFIADVLDYFVFGQD